MDQDFTSYTVQVMRLLGQSLDNQSYGRCYIISNLNAMTLLTGKEVSLDLFYKFIKDMLKEGHNPKYGKNFIPGPKRTIPRWKENMGDIIEVEQIGLFSPRFWVSIFRGRPMVVSINVGDQFRTDREDGALEDTVFDDVVTNGHAIVIKGWKMYDSRRDQKTYSFTRQYFESVQGLFKSNRVLLFKKR